MKIHRFLDRIQKTHRFLQDHNLLLIPIILYRIFLNCSYVIKVKAVQYIFELFFILIEDYEFDFRILTYYQYSKFQILQNYNKVLQSIYFWYHQWNIMA